MNINGTKYSYVYNSSDSLVDTGYDLLGHNMFAYCNSNPVMNEDKNGDVAWWVGAAAVGAAWDVGSYLWKNRNKGYSWKGIGKSALKGAVTGVAFGGAGKIASKVLVNQGRFLKQIMEMVLKFLKLKK